MSEKTLNYYLSLPYKIEIVPEEDGRGYTCTIPDLKGSVAFGETIEQALETINEVKRNWLEIALEQGWRIPEPIAEEFKEYSGKFSARLPRYLHRKLAELAGEEGTSLNQLVVAFLSAGVEQRDQGRHVKRLRAISSKQWSDPAKPSGWFFRAKLLHKPYAKSLVRQWTENITAKVQYYQYPLDDESPWTSVCQ